MTHALKESKAHLSGAWCGQDFRHAVVECNKATWKRGRVSVDFVKSGLFRDFSNLRKKEQLCRVLQRVDLEGTPISRDTIYCLLKGCAREKDLVGGRQLHSLMVSNGLDSIPVLGDHLIRLFASCGSLLEVNQVFCKISTPSVFTWNAMISAHANLGESERALELYGRMQEEGIEPDKFTFLSILEVCGNLKATVETRLVHDHFIATGAGLDLIVSNTLVDVYSKCGCLKEARNVFDNLANPDAVSWNTMIGGYAHHGHSLLALGLFQQMHQLHIKPSRVTFLGILKACSRIGAVEQGRVIHYQIILFGLESDLVVRNTLVDMYAKSGSLEEAYKVFDESPHHDVVSLSVMIAGYAQHGYSASALELSAKMQQPGTSFSKVAYLCVLKACGSTAAIHLGSLIHDQIVRSGLETDMVIGSSLINMYVKCGCLDMAHKVFNDLSIRDEVSWAAIISGYADLGDGFSALHLFKKMQLNGIKPSKVIFLYILKACCSIGTIELGRMIHVQINRIGLELDLMVGSTLIDMYAKCGSLQEACKLFEYLPNRNVVSWSALISGYAQHGRGLVALELFEKMQHEGMNPSKVTFLSALKACVSIHALKCSRLIHDQLTRIGLKLDLDIGNTLIDVYAKCGSLMSACQVFYDLPNHDVVSWDVMIAGYVQQGYGVLGLELFERMQQVGIKPSKVTYLYILKACSSIGTILQARLVHHQIIKTGLDHVLDIKSTIINMYARCESLEEARTVFDELSNRDEVLWSTMISAYAQHGDGCFALELLEKMQLAGTKPRIVTFIGALTACSSMGSTGHGRLIHDQIIRSGYEGDVSVGNGMIDMYAKCSSLQDARKVFDKLPDHDDVSWGVMITGYAQHGHEHCALDLFSKMQDQCIRPDMRTVSCILKACGSIGALGKGKQIHEHMIKTGLELDVVNVTTLIEMYAKCGSLEEAHLLFDRLMNRDVVSWGTMIARYAQCGNWSKASQCLLDMQQQGLIPDAAILTGILAACSHTGLVEEGCQYFNCMRENYCIIPKIEHYSCLIDLLGRAGLLDAAEDLLQAMPSSPDITTLTSFLTSCKTYGNIKLGSQSFDKILQLDPSDASGYVLISNIHAEAHMRGEVQTFHGLRKGVGVWKKPGMAWIEAKNKVCGFIVGGEAHAEVLKSLVDFPRKSALCGGSKEEAIAFAPVNTHLGEINRCTRDLRLPTTGYIADKTPPMIQLQEKCRMHILFCT